MLKWLTTICTGIFFSYHYKYPKYLPEMRNSFMREIGKNLVHSLHLILDENNPKYYPI